MIKSFVTGFGRIGEQRELKKVLENFWAGKTDEATLQDTAKTLRARHWEYQKNAAISAISVNDFSFYDLVLDNIITFGCVPPRFANLSGLEQYFALARGNKSGVAMEMTKWFNTNYHYIVPELCLETEFKLNSGKIISEYKEAKANGVKVIFVAPQFSKKSANLIAKETGSKVVEIDQLPIDWDSEIRKTAEIFAKSLK